jgi:hypothetical protein
MTTMSILVTVCVGVLGFYSLGLLDNSWAPLSYSPWIVAKISCSSLCVFDANVGLHTMDEKNMLNDFFIGSGFHM